MGALFLVILVPGALGGQVLAMTPVSAATLTGSVTASSSPVSIVSGGIRTASDPVSGPCTVTTLFSDSGYPSSVAVDAAGNVYVSDINNAVKEWVKSTNTVVTLVSSGVYGLWGVAVDGAGDVYFTDGYKGLVEEWVKSTGAVAPLVSSGAYSFWGVAVDGAGNVYATDLQDDTVREWVKSTNTAVTLVSSGLGTPRGIAVDGAGNVYIADSANNVVKEWVKSTNTVVTLVSSGLYGPYGVAVDGAGNVYIADSGDNAVKEWVKSTNTVVTLVSSGLNGPKGVAVDASGNVYIADTNNNAVEEYSCAATPTLTPTATPTLTPVESASCYRFEVSANLFRPAQGPVSIDVDSCAYPGPYSLKIYNSAGEHVLTLDDQTLDRPLSASYSWDGKNKHGDPCASGVYVLYLVEPFQVKTARVLLVR